MARGETAVFRLVAGLVFYRPNQYYILTSFINNTALEPRSVKEDFEHGHYQLYLVESAKLF